MEQKLPWIDADGRLWVWIADIGYRPEEDPQKAYRREYLKGIRMKGGNGKAKGVVAKAISAKVIKRLSQEAIEGIFTPDSARPIMRRSRLSPMAKKAQDATYPRRCRGASRFHADRTGTGNRRLFDQDEREILHGAQEGYCAICAKPLGTRSTKIDHVIPLSLGGHDGFGNVVGVHDACNSEKANDTPTGCEMIWLLMVNAKIGTGPIVY